MNKIQSVPSDSHPRHIYRGIDRILFSGNGLGKSLFPLKYRLLQWILILGLLTGCRHTISDTRYDTIAVPEERLTQVKAFDWQAMVDPQPPDISYEVVTIDSGTTELSLSLNQCRAMVMQNNLDLQVQWFNPKIAEEAVNTARAVFEPLAFSSFKT